MTTIAGSAHLEVIGQLKIATLVIGAIDLGLTASAYETGNGSEEYFLAIICIAFILSFAFVVGIITDFIPVTDVWRHVHTIYHGLMALLLAIGVLVMLISVLSHWSGSAWSKGQEAARFIAIILGFVNSSIYGYISFGIFKAVDA